MPAARERHGRVHGLRGGAQQDPAAQARLAWVAARVADDRATAIRDARAELQRLRAATNDAHVHLTIDYYDARVDMLARHLAGTRELRLLDATATTRPPSSGASTAGA